MTRTSTKHLLVLAIAALALALCVALASAGGPPALAKSATAATKRDDKGSTRKAATRRCAGKHREDRRGDRHGRKCTKRAHHARHGHGADDRAGDDHGSGGRGADDPAGDDHGSGGHGADDGPGHT